MTRQFLPNSPPLHRASPFYPSITLSCRLFLNLFLCKWSWAFPFLSIGLSTKHCILNLFPECSFLASHIHREWSPPVLKVLLLTPWFYAWSEELVFLRSSCHCVSVLFWACGDGPLMALWPPPWWVWEELREGIICLASPAIVPVLLCELADELFTMQPNIFSLSGKNRRKIAGSHCSRWQKTNCLT